MPLSSKLKADYIELINQQLDRVQIDSVEDFELAQQALQNIIQPTTGYDIPEKYREKMFLIKDYLQSPEYYVEHEQNYNEYKQIIIDRITVKIDELQSLSATQKQSYIQNQQDHRARTTTNQQIMSQHRPPQPGSDAHVQTEAQWLAELQRQLSNHLTPQPSRLTPQEREQFNYRPSVTDYFNFGSEQRTTERLTPQELERLTTLRREPFRPPSFVAGTRAGLGLDFRFFPARTLDRLDGLTPQELATAIEPAPLTERNNTPQQQSGLTVGVLSYLLNLYRYVFNSNSDQQRNMRAQNQQQRRDEDQTQNQAHDRVQNDVTGMENWFNARQ